MKLDCACQHSFKLKVSCSSIIWIIKFLFFGIKTHCDFKIYVFLKTTRRAGSAWGLIADLWHTQLCNSISVRLAKPHAFICFKQCQRVLFQVQVWLPLYFTIILCLGIWTKATRNLKSRNEVQSKQQTRVKLTHTGLLLAQMCHLTCKSPDSADDLTSLSVFRYDYGFQNCFRTKIIPMIIEGVSTRLQIEHFLLVEKSCFLWNATCRKAVVCYFKRVSGMSSVYYQILYLPTPFLFFILSQKLLSLNHWSFLEGFDTFCQMSQAFVSLSLQTGTEGSSALQMSQFSEFIQWILTIQCNIFSGQSTSCLHQTLFLMGTSSFPTIPITADTFSISS